jgi:hypothetical protein
MKMNVIGFNVGCGEFESSHIPAATLHTEADLTLLLGAAITAVRASAAAFRAAYLS